MNISFNGYSLAADFGETLSAPLDSSIFNIKYSVRRAFSEGYSAYIGVIQLIWYGTLGAITFVPLMPFWMAGRTISILASSKVNFQGLHYKPQEIDLNPLQDNKKINLNYLKTCLSGVSVSKISKVIELTEYISSEAGKQYGVFLRAIVKKMIDGDAANDHTKLSDDQKATIIRRLVDASEHCFPTSVRTAGDIYFELFGGDDTESKVLRIVQGYKDAIISQIIQVDLDYSQWHVINYTRGVLGDELGLDKSLIQFDDFSNNVGRISSETLLYIKDVFLQRYANANRMVEAVHFKLSELQPTKVYSDFSKILKEIAKDRGIENDPSHNNIEDFVSKQCFTADYQIKPEAVNLILRKLNLVR
jgi:hypothetical protein